MAEIAQSANAQVAFAAIAYEIVKESMDPEAFPDKTDYFRIFTNRFNLVFHALSHQETISVEEAKSLV